MDAYENEHQRQIKCGKAQDVLKCDLCGRDMVSIKGTWFCSSRFCYNNSSEATK